MPFNTQAEAIWQRLATRLGGASDPRYVALRSAVESSPQLTSSFNSAAIATRPLVDIVITTGTADAMSFNPSNNTIDISPSHLAGLVAGPDGATLHLAHELQHFFDSIDTSPQSLNSQRDTAWTNLHTSITSFNGNTANTTRNQDLTSYVQNYINIHLADEAAANFAAWNAVVSKRVALNNGAPLSSAAMTSIKTSPIGRYLFDSSGNALGGISLAADGTIALSSANLAAESLIYGSANPSNSPTPAGTSNHSISYRQYYAAGALSGICSLEAGKTFTIDFASLGLKTAANSSTVISDATVAANLVSGHVQPGTTGVCRVVDQSGGATYSFSTSGGVVSAQVSSAINLTSLLQTINFDPLGLRTTVKIGPGGNWYLGQNADGTLFGSATSGAGLVTQSIGISGSYLPTFGQVLFDPIVGLSYRLRADGNKDYIFTAPPPLQSSPAPLATPTAGAIDFQSFASSFGSTLGRLLGGKSLLIGTVSGAAISAIALSVGQQLFSVGYYPHPGTYTAAATSNQSVFQDFGNNLGSALINAGVGAVSSYLSLELGQAVGLDGFGAQLFASGVGGLLGHVLSNAVNNVSLFSGIVSTNAVTGVVNAAGTLSNVGNLLSTGLAGFFGQQLASLIVTPTTPVEALFGSLGAAALSVFADTSIAGLLGIAQASALAGPVGVLVGTFVGFVVGVLFGGLFGHRKPRTPSASAETILTLPFAHYAVGGETSANGGNLQLASAMAVAAKETLNGLIAQVTGGRAAAFVANGVSPTQIYGVNGSQIYVKLGIGAAQTNVATADDAVSKGVLWALPQTQIIGGNILIKRAIANGVVTSVLEVLGNLQVASDYALYRSAAPAIDAAVAAAYQSLSTDDRAFYASNRAFITRAFARNDVPLSGADQAFYNANSAQVDRILSVQISSFAAGWIVTLQRAEELRLDQFGASDFFGGLQGFLQSFAIGATGRSTHYEDISIGLSGGSLSITASGPGAAGLFSLMPQASSDGSSVTIAGFGAQVGYVEQYIGNRSSSNDIEIAAPGSGAVTVYAGQPGYYNGYYGSYPGTDGGSDIIIGAGGNDYLAAGSGGDWIDGQGGNDQIYGGAGRSVLLGGDGDDQIIGGSGGEFLSGGTGNDYLDGGNGGDVLVGGSGSDTLHGSGGDDILLADDDGGSYDVLDGGAGSDTVSYERFGQGVTADISGQGPSNLLTKVQAGYTLYRNQTIYSPDGQYRFIFQNDQNLVLYGPGNAVLWASNTRNGGGYRVVLNTDGNLVMYKSNGSIKWQSYSGGHSGATLTLDNAGQLNIDDQDGTAYWTIGGGGYVSPVNSSVNGDLWTSIENITGTDFNDQLTGTNYGSVLKGLGGNDVLNGGSGDDVLEGGSGADQINGGGGINVASYAGSEFAVYVNLGTGSAIGGDASGDTFSNIQNLIGSFGNDELAGDGGTNVIKTGEGDDWIDATAGYDMYDGGSGYDTVDYSLTAFVSGTAQEVYYDYSGYPYYYDVTVPAVAVTIGDGGGSVSYRAGDGSTGYQSFQSIEHVIGTASDDSFSSAGSTLNITWNGGAGADTFSGGEGSDTYVFGHGFGYHTITDTSAASNSIKLNPDVTFDDLWVSNAAGTLQVGIRGEAGYMSVYSNFATAGNDVIKTLDMGGAGHVDITQINAVYGGGDGDDGISGDSSTANLIFAYNGNDTIYAANGTYSYQGSVVYAGLGNDTVVTSVGDDQFLFERGNGHDYVIDGGGQNTIVFGSTVAADDILYQIIGNDLFIGIKDLDNPNLTASQVADTIQIVGGAVKNVGTTYGTTYWNTSFSVEAGGATTDLTKANIAWVVNAYDDSYQGYGGGYGGGWGPYGGGYIPPIVLDLHDDGLEITPVAQSNIVTRDAAGNVLRTSWVGPTNGILAYDRNSDGRVDNTADIAFRQDKKGAKTDLEGLSAWDSNGDGMLDVRDADFAKLVVWTDANQDGQQELGEVVSLLAAGVASIDLKGKPTGFDGKDNVDTIVHNTTSFTRIDGAVGTAYDVALARRALGDGAASSILGAKDLGGVAAIGRLTNDPLAAAQGKGFAGTALTAGAADTLAGVEIGGTVATTIDAVAADRWANVLDPTLRAARQALLAGGMQGTDLLQTIRTTMAHGDDWTALFGRGLRTTATRLQAVVIDFNRSGADLIDPTTSIALADVSHTGTPVQIGWVKSSDGVLAFDADGNGQVDVANEVDFTGKVANGKSAFQGLGAYDTNKDGTLDAADGEFAKFLIWRDKNANGRSDVGEVQSLGQAGVKQFDLVHQSSRSAFGSAAANEVLGVGKVVFTDGSSRATYDVALGFADGDTSADPAPTATPTAKTSIIGEASSLDQGGNESSGLSAAAGTQSPAGLTGVGRMRGGLSGQSGQVVSADAAPATAPEWWRDPAAVGGDLAALASPQLVGDDGGLGANRSSLANASVGDAAQLQRILLLRQNMAALHGDTGGAAAIWNRGAANDMPLAAATANGYAAVPASSLTARAS